MKVLTESYYLDLLFARAMAPYRRSRAASTSGVLAETQVPALVGKVFL
jgi:hypothetical protein